MRVLVTEDDEDLRLAVESSLRGSGFAVDVAKDLPDADEALSVNAYDCVVLDRMLPAGDSLDYVGERRRDGWEVPVLFLTARDTIADRIAGLALADDYLVKPFAMAELIARVRSLCRRADPGAAPVLDFLDLELDIGRHEARRGGVTVPLTGKEFAVLHRLVVSAGEPVWRRDLTDAGWDELVPPSPNALEVLIAQLRHKLGPPPVIHTVRGVGYVLRG